MRFINDTIIHHFGEFVKTFRMKSLDIISQIKIQFVLSVPKTLNLF